MDLTDTTWLSAVPVVFVTMLVLWIPGAVASRLAGLRGLAMIAIAPGISVTAVATGGAVAPILGLRWGPLAFVVVVTLLWLLAGGVGRLLRRSPQMGGGSVPAGLAAVGLAFVGVLAVVLPVTGSPESFPQHPDTIFHLGNAQWMLDHGDISAMHVGGFTSGSGGGFYPAAWHGVVVTVAQITHAPVVVSSSCLALVTAGIIWPLAMVLLARTVFGPGLGISVAAGVTSVAFSAFPFWLMGYGVLWPNLLGQALLPAALACLVVLTRPVKGARSRGVEPERAASGRPSGGKEVMSRGRAALVLVAVVPGLAFAHPNALIAFVVLGCLVLGGLLGVGWRARRDRPRVAVGAVTALVVGTVLVGGGWLAATAASGRMRASNAPGPEMTWSSAMVDTIAFGPREAAPLWALAVLVFVGAVVILFRGAGHRWVVAGLILADGLYFLVVAVDSPLTRVLTWPWYNNAPRLAALMVLPASLAATAALSALGDTLIPLLRRIPATPLWVAWVIPSLVLTLATGGGYVAAHREILDPYFHPLESYTWASPTELRALQTLAARVPAHSEVAANPWNGGTYMYLVSGRHMLFPTEKSVTSPDQQLLAKSLDKAGTSPEVCAAAVRQHVGYAITGGSPFMGLGRGYTRFKGVDRVGSSSAFREVASAKPYRLYELVRCAGG